MEVSGKPHSSEDTISVPTYGELLFERYLESQGITFEREPALPGIAQRVDFVVDHPKCGKILLEVKDIETGPAVLGLEFVDGYRPIRTHIQAGSRKFRNTADYLCALVLAAPPTSLVQLDDPITMLGAMYGDYGFRIPVNTETGTADPDRLEPIYITGKGKMIRKAEIQNTRIAAVISVIDHKIWHYAMRKYINTDDGRTRAERAYDVTNVDLGLPDYDAVVPGVTVWENGVASRELPKDLFRGEMDARWEATEDGRQLLTFIGDLRRHLQVDKKALDTLGIAS
jgi:hypothetical protein